MKCLTAKNDLPTPMWLAFTVLGFVVFWPLGLAILIYVLWSGKMNCCIERMTAWKDDRIKCWDIAHRESLGSGNTAFDEYRETTLKRLVEERREFTRFLDKLRRAKDQDEFDAFMAEQQARQSNT